MKGETPITIKAPASKSLSHRALIAGALSPGKTVLSGVLDSQDISRTKNCLAACGASFMDSQGRILVTGMENGPAGGETGPIDLNVGESGTTCRLLTGVLAAGKGLFRVFGEGRMHDRPIGALTRTLETLGVEFEWEGKREYPPFVLKTKGLPGGNADISLEESSQYLSGLLLAAPFSRRQMTITVSGGKVVSWPYVALTLMTLKDFGVSVQVQILDGDNWTTVPYDEPSRVEPGRIRFLVEPGPYKACAACRVEGDWSNASYFLAAGAIGPNPVKVMGLRKNSLQGDRAILEILKTMGATVNWDDDRVTVSPARLHGAELDMGHCPDLVPTVAVAASMAEGTTVIRNVAHLRIKESDRLEALATNLAKTGCLTELLPDGIRIEPKPMPKGAKINFETFDDHRMAMSMSLHELADIEVTLDNPGCVAKSFPRFFEEWKLIAEAVR